MRHPKWTPPILGWHYPLVTVFADTKHPQVRSVHDGEPYPYAVSVMGRKVDRRVVWRVSFWIPALLVYLQAEGVDLPKTVRKLEKLVRLMQRAMDAVRESLS